MKNNSELKWKTLFLLLLLIPVIGLSQTKNVISTNRIFPKVDKQLEFEKALATHAQKYHSGDVKWRVFQIQSGPDAGGYHIVKGPKSWESEDTRGDINEAHNTDWHKNVTIYLTEKYSNGYSVYIDSLSTVAVGDYSDKVQVTHVYPKSGCGNKGTITIKLEKHNDYILHLEVIDDGIGKTGIIQGTGFGGQLISLLIQQLNGYMTEVIKNGTTTIIDFRLT